MKKKPLRLSPLTLAIASALCAPSVHANPTGAQVVSGAVSVNVAPGITTINQSSNRAIVNWQSFSIQSGETTRFNLPSANSAILNRVVTGNPSQLLGTLSSNGQVFLLNPNGVLVGAGATINTGAFVASTRDVSNAQFMLGDKLDFFGSSNAAVTNLGTIHADSGDVVLIGYQVDNQGSITAPQGVAALASGTQVLLAPSNAERIVVKPGISNVGGSVDNSGVISAAQAELKAAGGNPYALAVNAGGSIGAVRFQNVGGRVLLSSQSGKTQVSGDIKAGNGNIGGTIQATGTQVTLASTAILDASGAQGGGTVLVGGDFQGKNAAVQNAQNTTVEAGARIKADALAQGNGGKVVVWADNTTDYRGTASARGGASGGNGGEAEVSGKQKLGYTGTVDLRAPHGKTGNLLLDPTDVTITDAGVASGSLAVAGNTSTIHITDLNNALQLANVTLNTTSGGAGQGDITVATGTSPYVFFAPHDLTLLADRDIIVNESLSVVGASQPNLTLQAGRNLTINNPDGMKAVTAGGTLTLIADAANGGAGNGRMTLAPDLVLGGNVTRLFVPTPDLLTMPVSVSFLVFNPPDPKNNLVTGKWVGDAGTDGSGIYFHNATATARQLEPQQNLEAAKAGTCNGLCQNFQGLIVLSDPEEEMRSWEGINDQQINSWLANIRTLEDWMAKYGQDQDTLDAIQGIKEKIRAYEVRLEQNRNLTAMISWVSGFSKKLAGNLLALTDDSLLPQKKLVNFDKYGAYEWRGVAFNSVEESRDYFRGMTVGMVYELIVEKMSEIQAISEQSSAFNKKVDVMQTLASQNRTPLGVIFEDMLPPGVLSEKEVDDIIIANNQNVAKLKSQISNLETIYKYLASGFTYSILLVPDSVLVPN